MCFDWNYIAGLGSPLWVPLQTLTNSCIGYLLCTLLFMALYYGNVWNAQNFPFLAQVLFTDNSTSTDYAEWNQTLVLDSNHEISRSALADYGLPNLTATYIAYLITTNMGITATLVHMFLWEYDSIKTGWAFAHPKNLKKLLKADTWRFWIRRDEDARRQALIDDPELDPHYKLTLRYADSPTWWFGLILVGSFITSFDLSLRG